MVSALTLQQRKAYYLSPFALNMDIAKNTEIRNTDRKKRADPRPRKEKNDPRKIHTRNKRRKKEKGALAKTKRYEKKGTSLTCSHGR